MNKTFKVIFNRARGTLMVANEITRSVQKKGTKTVLATAVALALTSTAALADGGTGSIDWNGTWDSDSYPTGTSVDVSSATANVYGVSIKSGATGEAKGKTSETQTKSNLSIGVTANGSSTYAVFGILGEKTKVSEGNPTFAGDSLTVNVSTNFTGGAQAIGTNQYVNVSAGTTTLSATSSGGNSWGVTATGGGQVDLSSSSSTTINSSVSGSNYTNTGSVYGVYAEGKSSAATPVYSQVNLASKKVDINVTSDAAFSSGYNGVAIGIQVAGGATVSAMPTGTVLPSEDNPGSLVSGSTLTIKGTSKQTAPLTGINVVGASGSFKHETTTINLNVSKHDKTDGNSAVITDGDGNAIQEYDVNNAANATGIAVTNKSGETTIDSGVGIVGKLETSVRSSTGKATGIYVTGETTTQTGSDVKKKVSEVLVDGDATIRALTTTGTAYGIDIEGFCSETKSSETSNSSYDYPSVTIFGNVDISAEGDSASSSAPTVVGVFAKTGAVNLGTTALDSTVKIEAKGSAERVLDNSNVEIGKKTTAVIVAKKADDSKASGEFNVYGKTVEITSSGDGIMVSGGEGTSDLDGTGTASKNYKEVLIDTRTGSSDNRQYIEGSSIRISALDNAINAKDDSDVGLYSETINIEVTGKREVTDALVFDKGIHEINGKFITVNSKGDGLSAKNGSKVTIGDSTFVKSTESSSESYQFLDGSTLSITSPDVAVYVDGKSKVYLGASDVTIESKTDFGTVQVQNNGTVGTTVTDSDNLTKVVIAANNLTVNNQYSSGDGASSSGSTFVAQSNTKLDVQATGALVANAVNGKGAVVRAYGNAVVTLEGAANSALNGDIVFAPHTAKNEEGTADVSIATKGQVNLALSGEDAEWSGRSYIDKTSGTGSSYTPDYGDETTQDLYVNNTVFDVSLSNGAGWTVTGDSFFNSISLNGFSGVDASNDKVDNFSGAGRGSEKGLISVSGIRNELYINEDADITGLHVAMVGDSRPELIVDTLTAFDIDTTVDGTITEASNRLTFDTTVTNARKGMLTIEEEFSINSKAFNATAGDDTQNEAIEHYNFLQGTLVTQNSATAEVETQLRLNKIQGELDAEKNAIGALLVKSGNRVDVMPYTTEDGAEEERVASTALGTLTLEKGASFYATNNDSVTATNIATSTEGSSESQALVKIESTNADSDKRTVTTIGTLELATKDTFEAINNKSVKITTATVGEDAKLTLKDVKLASASDDKVTPVTETEITTLNVQKTGKFIADKNKSVKLTTVNVASLGQTQDDASVNVTDSGEVTVTTLNVGDNAKVSATGNTSVVIDHVKAGSTLTGDTGTGASANIVLQNNTGVTVKNIATGASATVTVTENTNTAQIGDYTGETLTGVISLGSKSTLTAQDASLYATSVTLADGESDSAKTKLDITGDTKDVTDGHYDNVKVAVTDLNLGNYSEVTLTNNKEVAIANVKAGSGITGATDSNGTKAKMEVTGSETVTIDNLKLGNEGTFNAKSNATVTVKNIETAASATVTVTDNTETAQIGDYKGETLTGVISLESKSTLTAQDASLYATSVTLADGDDTTKTKLEITGDAKDATDSHYDNVKVAVTDLKLGNYSEVTLTKNKSVTLGTVSGVGQTAGTNTALSITGSEAVTVTTLKLGESGTFTATGNGKVSVGSITTGASAAVTIGGENDDQTAQIGSVSLGSNSTMNATNAIVAGENNAAVNVTVGSGATFNLTSSDKASSYVDTLSVSGTFTAKDATVNVNELTGAGKVNVGVAAGSEHTGANMYVKTLSMSGGSIYVDPIFGETSVLTVESLGEENTLNTKITAGPGALVSIGAGSAEAAVAAVKANVEANSNSTNNLANAGSLIYVAQPVTLGENASLMSNPEASAGTTADSKTINVSKGGALIVDQSKVGSQAFTGVTKVSVDESSTLAVINVVAGTSFSLADADTTIDGTITSVTDSPFVIASVNSDHRKVNLTGTATDAGMSVIASMGVQSMLRRADMVLAETVADHSVVTLDSTKGVALWADVRGEQYKQTSLGHGAGFKTNIGYGTVGAEVAPTDSTSLGIAFQYGRGTVKGDLYNVKNKTKNYGATLYGSTMLGATGVKLVGEIAYIKSDNDITNSYYTGLNQDLDAKIFSAGLTVQKNFKLGSFDVTPSLGVRLSKLKTDDMKAGLSTIEDQSQTLVQVPVAVRFSAKTFETASGWGITPKFKLAVVPTFGDKSIEVFDNKRTVIDASPFQGALGVTFTKGNFSVNATANAGAGQRGSKAFGGKVGVNYRF